MKKETNGNGIGSLFADLRRINADIADLNKEKSVIKQKLSKLIPPGKEKANVRHDVASYSRTDFKQVFTDVRNQLVPKSKLLAVEAIVELHTKNVESHTFREAE
jgi:hypothetical protein